MDKKTLKILLIVVVALSLFASSVPSFAGGVTVAPNFVPSFPMLAGDNVMIMWIPVPGAVKYKIYLDGKPVGESQSPPFTTSAPTEAGTFNYTITGVDAGGEEGPASSPGNLTIVKLEQPKNIMHQFLGEVLNFRWDAEPNAVIYDVSKAEAKDGPYKLITSTADSRFVDPDVKETDEFFGKTFYYKIVSKDKFNKTSPDKEIYEVNVVKPVVNTKVAAKEITLKIMRSKPTMFAKPMGEGTDIRDAKSIFFLSDGSPIYCDGFGKIAILDKFGDQAKQIGERGVKEGQYQEISYMAVDDNDDIYITEYRKRRLIGYNKQGAVIYDVPLHITTEERALLKFTRSGRKPVGRVNPRGILIYKDKIYIADVETGAIQIYNKADGEFVDYLTDKEKNEVIVNAGVTIILAREGKIYLANSLGRTIYVHDIETGAPISVIGVSKSFIGAFISISGMGFDKDGNLIVSDAEMSSVQVFSKDDYSYMYNIGAEKAIPDPRSNNQRPFVREFQKPGTMAVDKTTGKLWVYVGGQQGFTVREFVGDKPWDATVDQPEGTVPKNLLEE